MRRGLKHSHQVMSMTGMAVCMEQRSHLSEVALPERDAPEIIQAWEDPAR